MAFISPSIAKCLRCGLPASAKSTLNVYLNNIVWMPSAVPVNSLTTSSILRDKNPFEDLLREAQKPKVNKSSSKMLSQDPPISIRDIYGKPIEPIDINIWNDPEELAILCEDFNILRKIVSSSEFAVANDIFEEILKRKYDLKTRNSLVEDLAKSNEETIKMKDTEKEDIIDKENTEVTGIKETKSSVVTEPHPFKKSK